MIVAEILKKINLDRLETRTIMLDGQSALVEKITDREIRCLTNSPLPPHFNIQIYIASVLQESDSAISGSFYFTAELLSQKQQGFNFLTHLKVTTLDEQIKNRKGNRIKVFNLSLTFTLENSSQKHLFPLWDISSNGISGIPPIPIENDQILLFEGLDQFFPDLPKTIPYRSKSKIMSHGIGLQIESKSVFILNCINSIYQELEKASRYFDTLLLHANSLSKRMFLEEGLMSIEFLDRQLSRKKHILEVFMPQEDFRVFVETINYQAEFIKAKKDLEENTKRVERMRQHASENNDTICMLLDQLSKNDIK